MIDEQEAREIRGRIMHVLGDVQSLVEHVNALTGIPPVDERKTFPLKRLRRERGWTHERVACELQRAAARSRNRIPDRKTLRCMIIDWESEKRLPNTFYRELLHQSFMDESVHAQDQASPNNLRRAG